MPAIPTTKQSAALVAAFLSLAALAACDPISANQSPVLISPQIEMTSQSLANDTAVQTPVLARVPGTGQLIVNVQVENRTNDPMILEYQCEFLNHGIQKQEWSGWTTLRIPPRADSTAQVTSLEPEVDDFRLRFRRAHAE